MGDHGVGKTPFAAQWPKPLLADCENGRLSVASMGIPYANIKTAADMDALLDMVRRECLKPADKRQYETLIIDTIDSWQKRIILGRLKDERKEQLSGWADWGWLDGKMVALIEALLNLPMNVVVNLHTKDISEDDGDESRLVQKARLKGDIKDAIFQDFDLIGHMEQSYVAGEGAQKGERVRVRQIRWHAEPKYPSLRDRSNKLPRFTDVTFTQDDYWQIFNAITDGLDDLPRSQELESLAVEGEEAEVPGPDDKGGPVVEPAVPAKKAAKKAPAKKAAPAAKKVAEPEPEPEPTPDPEPEAPADDVATDVPTDDEAEQRVKEELGGEVVSEEPAEEPTPEPEPQAKAEPAPAAAEDKPAPKRCGDQPKSMEGKFDAVPGCQVELSAENAGKAQIAMVKYKTYLCNDCLASKQAASAS
jgi:hypothetical protein